MLNHGKSNSNTLIQFAIKRGGQDLLNVVFGETVGILHTFHHSKLDKTLIYIYILLIFFILHRN